MNVLKLLRKPPLAIILAFVFFYISCHQESIALPENQQSFNYSAFDFFKSNQNIIDPLIINKNYLNSKSKVEFSKEILNEINFKLGTNVTYPDVALDLINHDREEILKISLNQGWLNQKDIDLNNDFFNDLKNNGFDIALSNFENTALELQLSNDEFEKLNTFVNIMKAFNYKYPDSFNPQDKSQLAKQERIDWRCLGALIGLSAATAALLSCVTIVACAGAVLLHIIAIDAVASECEEYL